MYFVAAKVDQGSVVLEDQVRFFFDAREIAELEAFRLMTTVEVTDSKTGEIVHTSFTN